MTEEIETSGIRKPMLAKDAVLEKLEYPLWVQPKIDGIRFMIHNGQAYSRSLKLLPNVNFQQFIFDRSAYLEGMDGEVVVGSATDPKVFNETMSGIMSHEGYPDFKMIIFDLWDMKQPYVSRATAIVHAVKILHRDDPTTIDRIDHIGIPHEVINETELLEAYQYQGAKGYEGVILRKIDGEYKHGRSTVNEGLLLKMKPWKDSEAVIIGFAELLRNDNAPTISPTGHQVRSSHKDGKVPAGTLGKFIMKDDKLWPGQTFGCGSGLDDADRERFWKDPDIFMGKTATYKYLDIGAIDKPRHPIFKGLRDERDMSDDSPTPIHTPT